MKRLLNLGMSNPLTLGMAHPVADRLERLASARPTTWRSRCLSLSAMSVIAVASAPLSIASDTVSVKASHSLQMRLIPDREGIYMEELQRRLEAVSAGTHDQTYVTDWKGDGMGTLMENHIFVYVSGSNDEIKIATTDAKGQPITRTLSLEVMASVETALMTCVDQTSVSKLPLTYKTNLSAVPEYTLSGPHKVHCTPGTHEERMALSVHEKLEGLRLSPDIDEKSRRAMMRGTMAGEFRKEFEAKYENPTREQKHENCLYSHGILDTEYNFLGDSPRTSEEIQASCDKLHSPEL